MHSKLRCHSGCHLKRSQPRHLLGNVQAWVSYDRFDGVTQVMSHIVLSCGLALRPADMDVDLHQ
jgi:hypothetical protein